MKFLYKYPQSEFPYEQLKQESAHRGRDVSEYEVLDTDAFEEDRYWDVFVEVSFGGWGLSVERGTGSPRGLRSSGRELNDVVFLLISSVRQGRATRRWYLGSNHRLQPRSRPCRSTHPPSSVLQEHLVLG